MNLQNGYKVIYEKAADGKRTFYASKTGLCDTKVDKQLGDAFVDADYAGKTIYEYKGSFYVSEGKTPTYNEDGTPAKGETKLTIFDEVFVKVEPTETFEPEQVNEPVATEVETDPEVTEHNAEPEAD